MALQPVILAGGSGTRLWPLSRELYPKQFLELSGRHSFLQQTAARLDGLEEVEDIAVVCNEEHRFLVAEHLRQLGMSPKSIILEPAGRNTAPALALALAALSISDSSNGADPCDPVMLVMPADHLIRDIAAFQSVVRQGNILANEGYVVTFGIVPTSPKIGYGYIKRGRHLVRPEPAQNGNGSKMVVGAFQVDSFVEKPDRVTAEKMLETEDYLWNSGIFMMRASIWLQELQRFRPDIAEVCQVAHQQGQRDGDFYRPDAHVFAGCPSDSINYAVMEKIAGNSELAFSGTSPCVVLPLDAGWSDVGAWTTLWEDGERDENGNVSQGDVYTHAMTNSLLIGQDRLVATAGLDGVIVVETADAVLIAHKDYAQQVRVIVDHLNAQGRPEAKTHRKVHRPWGTYETVDAGPRFQVKRLTVNPGAALSLQMHHHRAEHWVVVKGTARVTRDDQVFLLTENQSAYVPVGVSHRLENPGTIPLEIIEVQSGSYLGEDDIVRFEDRYNRHRLREPLLT